MHIQAYIPAAQAQLKSANIGTFIILTFMSQKKN